MTALHKAPARDVRHLNEGSAAGVAIQRFAAQAYLFRCRTNA